MKTTKTTLYLGLNDKDTKTQKIDTVEAFKMCSDYFANTCGGCTIYAADGVYKHDNGVVVVEKTLKIELFDIDEQKIDTAIDTLKNMFNQESIIKQTDIVNSVFC